MCFVVCNGLQMWVGKKGRAKIPVMLLCSISGPFLIVALTVFVTKSSFSVAQSLLDLVCPFTFLLMAAGDEGGFLRANEGLLEPSSGVASLFFVKPR